MGSVDKERDSSDGGEVGSEEAEWTGVDVDTVDELEEGIARNS